MRSSGFFYEEIDDIITLEGLNQTRQWKFPDSTRCPLDLCRREFGYRAEAINHFKQRHARNAYYCSTCEEPIEVHRQDDVQDHNRRMHRHENADVSSKTSFSSSSSSSSAAENVFFSQLRNYIIFNPFKSHTSFSLFVRRMHCLE